MFLCTMEERAWFFSKQFQFQAHCLPASVPRSEESEDDNTYLAGRGQDLR